MTHTFKVGDKVRSIDPGFPPDVSNERYSTIDPEMSESFIEEMVCIIGEEGIITDIHPTHGYLVEFSKDRWGWRYLPEWLELVDPANPVG